MRDPKPQLPCSAAHTFLTYRNYETIRDDWYFKSLSAGVICYAIYNMSVLDESPEGNVWLYCFSGMGFGPSLCVEYRSLQNKMFLTLYNPNHL